MKKNIILAALFAVFTALCFILGGSFSEHAGVFLKVWYAAMLVLWCAFAIKFLSLSLKLKKLRRTSREKRELKRGKEKKK